MLPGCASVCVRTCVHACVCGGGVRAHVVCVCARACVCVCVSDNYSKALTSIGALQCNVLVYIRTWLLLYMLQAVTMGSGVTC